MKKQISILLATVVLLCLVFPSTALAATKSAAGSKTAEGVTMYGYVSATYSSSTYCKGYASTATTQKVQCIYSKVTLYVRGLRYGFPYTWTKTNSNYRYYEASVNTSTSWSGDPFNGAIDCYSIGTHQFRKVSGGTTYSLTLKTGAA